MEMRALKAFVEVARCGSFSMAADNLSVTQPTISKLVNKLEDELDTKLLRRSRLHCELTESGQIVLRYAEKILSNATSIEQALGELDGLKRGTLRIGVPSLGPRLFVPLIRDFKRHYPDIELNLSEDGSHAIEQSLIDGELEIGGLLSPVDKERFEHRMLIDDRLALLAPARSYWAKRDKVRLEELAEEPFVLFTAAYALNEKISQACQERGFNPHVVGRSGQLGFILELVRNGVGIALLPSSELSNLNTREFSVSALVSPVIPWRIDIAWLHGSYLSAAAKAWLGMLKSD